jgi:hypothetical protein
MAGIAPDARERARRRLPMPEPTTPYQRLIAERAPEADGRHVEAWMRVEHPTLDGLSPERFAAEVDVALACIAEAGPVASEALAASFGLQTKEDDMATTKTRRCIGSARFGIEPHEAPVKAFPKQPSQPDGLGRMCAEHWRVYVRGLNADRKARSVSGDPEPAGPQRDGAPEYASADEASLAKADRRQATKAEKASAARERRATGSPKAESPRLRKARETLAATERLGGSAYTDAVGSHEVQTALETVNGHGKPTSEQADAIEAIATEADPRSEDEVRALEGDPA